MSKISIKTDFVDGEKLFAQELNNNFLVIQAGINANEENLQEVIDKAIIELDRQLEEITADRGWDWNGGDRVTFYKGNAQAIEAREIINGQLLYNTETGETALDDNGERINTGSGNVVVVSDTQPTNEATKDWIKPVIINGTETAEEYFKNSNNQWKKILNQPSGDTLPIGSIAQFGGETALTNWLFCNGQAVSRETYSELFAVIGTTYGDGDGSTTFNVPDFSSRSPMGVGKGTDGTNTETTTLGQIKGEYKHKLTVNEMPSHNHNVTANSVAGSNTIKVPQGNYANVGNPVGNIVIGNTGGGQAHNTVHPVLGVNFIIKAKQSVGLVGNVVSDINAQGDNDVAPTKVIKEYVDKSIITAYLTTPIITTTDGFIKCQLDSSTSFGNKCILENGSIKIGKGVKKIKVNGNVTYRYDSGAIDVTGAYIKKNEETIAQSSTYKPDKTKPITASCSPFIVDVVEGDIISLYGYGQSSISTRIVGNSDSRVTYLTVEVVE